MPCIYRAGLGFSTRLGVVMQWLHAAPFFLWSPFTYKGDYNEKEAAIPRNLLIFVLPNLDLNQGPSD